MAVSAPITSQSTGLAGADFSLMMRLKDAATLADLVQANVSSITYFIWERSKPATKTTDTLDKTAVIFDTLQTGSGWDSVNYPDGHNFKWNLAGSFFPKEDADYRILLIVVSSGRTMKHIHDHRTLPWN